jgi:hypothetical protein
MSTYLVSVHMYGPINFVKILVDLSSIFADLYRIIYCVCECTKNMKFYTFIGRQIKR